MAPKQEFLYPLLYVGPKAQKDMSHIFVGRTLVFQAGPLSEPGEALEGQKYADVTEKEGRALVKRFPDLFKWPEGMVFGGPKAITREEYDDLLARVEALEAFRESFANRSAGTVLAKAPVEDKPAKGTGKPKKAPVEDKPAKDLEVATDVKTEAEAPQDGAS